MNAMEWLFVCAVVGMVAYLLFGIINNKVTQWQIIKKENKDILFETDKAMRSKK